MAVEESLPRRKFFCSLPFTRVKWPSYCAANRGRMGCLSERRQKETRSMRLLARMVVLIAVITLSATTDLRGQGNSQYVGSWIWVNSNGGERIQNNQSTLVINGNQRNGRYCYDSLCWDVQFSRVGDSYTFTTPNLNYWEFISPEPQVLIGRFWANRNNLGAPPSAVIRMRER